MALLTWNDSYSVKIKEIDDQHRKLVDMLNSLQEAMKARKGKEALTGILVQLMDYTKFHFGTEEKYFDQFGYPGSMAHKASHKDFVNKVLDFKKKFDQGTLALSLEVLDFLNDWVINHIKGVDKKYSDFFIEKGLK